VPVDRHTSGVSVGGSDEKRAEQREWRRGRRRLPWTKKGDLFVLKRDGRGGGDPYGDCRDVLLIAIDIHKRLGWCASSPK
jgi:hypothetical protein